MTGNGATPSAGESGPKRLKTYLELAGCSAAVLAASGYVSLRARLNFLGVGAVAEIEMQRLLFEAFSLLVTSAMILVSFGALVLILVAAVAAGFRSYRRHHERASLAGVHRWAILYAAALSPAVAVAALLIVLAYLPTKPALVGPVSALVSMDQNWLVFPLLLVVAAALACWYSSSQISLALIEVVGSPVAQAVRVFALLLLALLACTSAMAFSTQFQDMKFQEATLFDASGKITDCGLLVMTTDKYFYLWKVEGTFPSARGTIVLRTRSPDLRMRLGQIRDVAGVARGRPEDQFCSERLPP